jgi:hypothetical protein
MSTKTIKNQGVQGPHPDENLCDEDEGPADDASSILEGQSCIFGEASVPLSIDASGSGASVEGGGSPQSSCVSTSFPQEAIEHDEDPEMHDKSTSDFASSRPPSPIPVIGVTEAVYEEAKGLWGWGKEHVFFLGNVMGMVEHVADHVIHHVAGANLKDLDHGFVRPHLQAVDTAVLSPVVHVITKLIQDTSHRVVHELMRPILEQFMDQPLQLAVHNLEITFQDHNGGSNDISNYSSKENAWSQLANNHQEGEGAATPPPSLSSQSQLSDIDYLHHVSSDMSGSLYDSYDDNHACNYDKADGSHYYDDNNNRGQSESDPAFFIGYEDHHEDLSECWMPLMAFPPPNSPADYESSSLNLSLSETGTKERPLPCAYVSY